MVSEEEKDKKDMCCPEMKIGKRCHCASPGGGAVYGLGLIGVAVYYLQQATTFSDGVVGILKAIIWPALLIYKVFGLLGM